MADSLYPMTVRIQYEGCEVIGMIQRAQPRLTIALPTAEKSGRVKFSNCRAIGRTEAHVHAG